MLVKRKNKKASREQREKKKRGRERRYQNTLAVNSWVNKERKKWQGDQEPAEAAAQELLIDLSQSK